MRPTKGILLSAACALVFSTLVAAQGTRQTYLQDREFCNSGQSSQDPPRTPRSAQRSFKDSSGSAPAEGGSRQASTHSQTLPATS